MGSMDLDQIVADAQQSFEGAADITTLENEKARFLGKSGALTELLKGLGKLDPETRKTEGARINVAVSYTHHRAHETEHEGVCPSAR